MYVTDILDMYEESMEAMEYDAAIHRADEMINSISEGIKTFENLVQINSYYRKHGATQSFRELIGEEGIMDTITGALKSFAKWIIRKIKELIFFIADILANFIVGFADFFVSIVNYMRPVEVPYDLNKVVEGYVTASTGGLLSSLSFGLQIQFNLEFVEQVKAYCDRLYTEILVPVVEPDHEHPIKTNRAVIKKIGNLIDNVVVGIRTRCNTTSGRLEQACNQLARAKSDDELRVLPETLWDILKGIIPAQELRGVLSTRLSSAGIRTSASALIQAVSICLKHHLKCYRKIIPVMQELRKVYDNSRYAVHMEFGWDSGMRERFRAYFGGGRFDPGKIIVTNTYAMTWDKRPGVYKSSGLGGGTPFEPGATEQYTPDIIINLAFLRSKLKRIWAAKNGGSMDKYKVFIRILCHEARHVYNWQNHIVEAKPTAGLLYRFHKDERLAFKAMRRYEPTAEDLKWAKMILDKVEAEIQEQMDAKQA